MRHFPRLLSHDDVKMGLPVFLHPVRDNARAYVRKLAVAGGAIGAALLVACFCPSTAQHFF